MSEPAPASRAASPRPADSLADELLDELVPPQFDWRRMVRTYPVPAICIAAVGGYLLGRGSGRALVAAIGGTVAARVASHVEDAFSDDAP